MPTLKIQSDDVKDYLDWIKVLITICSAAVTALIFTPDAKSALHVQISALLFSLSLVFLIISFAGLIEHKHTTSGEVSWKTALPIWGAYLFFLSAFGALILGMFKVF